MLRAVPALAAAAVITFSSDHSARLGSLVFGGFAIVTAVALLIGALRAEHRAERTAWLINAVAGVAAAILALTVGASLPFLLVVLSGWAAITGFVELALGLRRRRRSAAARDWLFIGGLTALFAIVMLIIPPDFAQSWSGADGVSGVLTASIVAVGAFGAYGAIIGVFHVVAALSLKWAPTAASPETKEMATP